MGECFQIGRPRKKFSDFRLAMRFRRSGCTVGKVFRLGLKVYFMVFWNTGGVRLEGIYGDYLVILQLPYYANVCLGRSPM